MRSKLTLMLTPLLVLCMNFSFGQERIVSGNVVDQNGLPLPGVSVVVVGTSNGTQTDFDGNYSITASTGQTLSFSYLGQKTVTRAIGSAGTVNIQMEEDAQALEEVIVTGYGSKSRELSTSAIATVNTDQIEAFVPSTTVDNILQGQAAGVQVTGGNGRPGQTAFVQIRGAGSINASTTPLFIIDGVPLSIDDANNLNPLGNINPNDIETLTVLKDAATVSKYGSRGANGVVLITTKTGRPGDAKINFRSSYGFGKRAFRGFDLLDASQKLQLEAEYAELGVGGASGLPGASGDAELISRLLERDTDWEEELLRNSVIQSNSLSISGGSEKSSYFFSVGYDKNSGIIDRIDGFERVTARLNTTFQAKDWLSVGAGVSFARSSDDLPRDRNNVQNPFPAILTYNPYETLFLLDDNNNFVLDDQGERIINNTGTVGFPIARALVTEPDTRNNFIIIGNAFADVTLSENFSNRFSVGATTNRLNRLQRSLPGGVLDGFIGDVNFPGTQFNTYVQDFEYNVNNIFSYTNTFGDKHNFGASFLLEYNENIVTTQGIDVRGFPSPDFPYLSVSAEPTGARGTERRRILFSQGLFLDYDYDGKYIATASIRRDGSSRFGPDNKFGTFYSASAAWNISNEDFMENSVFNNLKLRASYGTSGNQNIGNFEFLNLLSFDTYNGTSTAIPVGVGNPQIQWESQAILDIGLEFGLFNNRISGVLDYFVKNSEDLLLDRPLSRIVGDENNSIVSNVGEIRNRGWEFSITADIVRAENFVWSAGGNITTLNNEVIALVDGNDIPTGTFGNLLLREGEELNSYFLVEYAGVNPDNGAPQYIDLDGNVTEEFSDGFATLQEDKSPLPDIQGGFFTSFRYKGFGLRGDFAYQAGNYIVNNERAIGTFIGGINNNLRTDVLNYWRQPGDTNVLPSPAFETTGDQFNSTRWLERGDFIRLRTLTLDYNLPSSITKDFGIDSFRIFATGQNIWTITGFNGDPEIGLGSAESGEPGDDNFVVGEFNLFSYPQIKSYTFGVEIGF